MAPQSEPIDVEPGVVAPPAIVSRVTAFHRYLFGMRLASDGKSRRFLPACSVTWPETPPAASPEEIADQAVRWVLAESAGHGPGLRYILQLRCRSDAADGRTTFDRWIAIRTGLDAEGELEVMEDDDLGTQQHGMAREFIATIETANRILCDQMERIGKMTAHHVEVANAVSTMSAAVRESMAANTEQQIRLWEIIAAGEADERAHAHRTERLRRISDFFAPSAERVAYAAEDWIRTMTTPPTASASGPDGSTPTRGQRLDAFIASLSEVEMAAFQGIFSPDEVSVIDALRKADDDAAFFALRSRLAELLAPRADEVRDAIVRAIGVTRAMELDRLLR